MTFTIMSWQQAVGTLLFFFVGAFSWYVGAWAAGKLIGRVDK